MKARTAFAVRLSAVLRVKPFISKEEVRYYLNGVHISAASDGGAICAATDGHRLGARHDRDGVVFQESIVRVPAELKVAKGLFASPWLVGTLTSEKQGYISVIDPLSSDEDTAEAAIARVEDCSLRIGRGFVDGVFPDWRRIVPTPSAEDITRGFNADYIKTFGSHLAMRGRDSSAPHLIEVPGEPEFIGVLMPMRAESKGKLPDWLATPRPAQKKAA